MWWQQYVLGADRTLVVWEQHRDFVPLGTEPKCQWVERDENEIHMLVGLANRMLEALITPGILAQPGYERRGWTGGRSVVDKMYS